MSSWMEIKNIHLAVLHLLEVISPSGDNWLIIRVVDVLWY
jgi:hypothetical protein